MEATKYGIANLGSMQDIRKQRESSNKWTGESEDMYDSLINLILNHKVEMQKVPIASSMSTAGPWAQKRGMRAAAQDLNGDGDPEVVVYNKSGKPVIINGYKLKGSDFAVRKKYYDSHPSSVERAAEPMKEWAVENAYDIKVDPNNPWKRKISNTILGDYFHNSGYKPPTRPKKQQTVFSIFTKLISPYVKEFLESGGLVGRLFGANSDVNNLKFMKKIVSPITMYRMLYLRLVERPYFFALSKVFGRSKINYEIFKEYIKNNPDKFWTFFRQNYLSADLKDFRQGKITPEVMNNAFINGDIQWDGSDYNDAIVFLLGKRNVKDETFLSLLTNKDDVANFFGMLENKKNKVEYKKAAKLLEQYKVIAREDQKTWFKELVNFFEHEDALDKYLALTEAGKNPINDVKKDGTEDPGPGSPQKIPNETETLKMGTDEPADGNADDDEEKGVNPNDIDVNQY